MMDGVQSVWPDAASVAVAAVEGATTGVETELARLSIKEKMPPLDDDVAGEVALPPPPSISQALVRPEGISDEAWERRRYRTLLARMLELEQPQITDKMIEFLLQDGVVETFVSFITQIKEDDELRIDPPLFRPHSADGGGATAGFGDDKEGGDAAAAARGSSGRPEPGGAETEELRRSYRATMLLACDQPSEALLAFLGQRAREITSAAFKVFWPGARGSFHHACRVIDYMLRFHADQVLDCVGRNKKSLERYLGPMLRWTEWPPVCETFVKLVALSGNGSGGPNGSGGGPNGSGSQYQSSPPGKWKLYSGLAEWRLLPLLARGVTAADQSPAHASSCADLLLEVVDRLSKDENGELLLQPIGHSPEFIDGLVDAAIGTPTAGSGAAAGGSGGGGRGSGGSSDGGNCGGGGGAALSVERRTDAARTLVGLVEKAAEENLVCNPGRVMAFTTQNNTVPNRLNSVKPLLHERLQARFADLCTAAIATQQLSVLAAAAAPAGGANGGIAAAIAAAALEPLEDGGTGGGSGPSATAVSSTMVERRSSLAMMLERRPSAKSPPFTLLRFLLLTVIAEVTERSPAHLNVIPLPLWRLLCEWFFRHPNSNLYQRLFYRLVYRALRANSETALQNALQRCRLLTALADAYERGDADAANRGFILQLCNAVRLQAETLPPSAFLRGFLQSHEAWKRFVPTLRAVTLREQVHGMGFPVPQPTRFVVEEVLAKPGAGGVASPTGLGEPDGIDHGSRFACSLGFDGEIPFPIGEGSGSSGGGGVGGMGGGAGGSGGAGGGKARKRKKRKKKGVKEGGGGGGSGGETDGGTDAEGDVDDDADGDAGEDAGAESAVGSCGDGAAATTVGDASSGRDAAAAAVAAIADAKAEPAVPTSGAREAAAAAAGADAEDSGGLSNGDVGAGGSGGGQEAADSAAATAVAAAAAEGSGEEGESGTDEGSGGKRKGKKKKKGKRKPQDGAGAGGRDDVGPEEDPETPHRQDAV